VLSIMTWVTLLLAIYDRARPPRPTRSLPLSVLTSCSMEQSSNGSMTPEVHPVATALGTDLNDSLEPMSQWINEPMDQ
jgi:hypothetical protein